MLTWEHALSVSWLCAEDKMCSHNQIFVWDFFPYTQRMFAETLSLQRGVVGTAVITMGVSS